MTTLINQRYRFDPTGEALSNLIVDEIHSVPQNGARLIIAREGLFYTREFTVRPSSGGPTLTLNQDYHFISIDADITAQTGLETATGIEFDNPQLFGDYILTYHCVGGVEGNSNALMADLKEAIERAKDAPVDWNKLIDVPAQFPPEWHPHQVTDLIGLEAVKDALNRLELAIYDSRPLQLSGLNLHWQDQRILHLLSTFNDRLNTILARVLDIDIDAKVQAAVALALANLNQQINDAITARLNVDIPALEARLTGYVDANNAALEARIRAYVDTSIANSGGGTGGGGTGGTVPIAPSGGTPNGVTLSISPSELSWSAASGATSYDVYVDGSIVAASITSTNYTLSAALADGTYSWYIVAKNSTGNTQGPNWNFTIDSAVTVQPPTGVITGGTPNNVTITYSTVNLDWSPVTNATHYDVVFDGATIVTDITTSQYTVPGTKADGSYSWYVIAKNSAGSLQSPTWNFSIDTTVVITDDIYDNGIIGVTPVPGPGEELEPDTIDLGSPDAPVVITGDVYNNGVIGVTPTPGPGEELEPDTIDLGTPDANIVTELYPGLDVYDAGGILSPTTPVPEGAIIENDTIDLNPAP